MSIAPLNGFAGFPTDTTATQTFQKQNKKKEFKDPLSQWPVRGMAFTNDIGAAIMDIAPKAGTAFWVPALMYFGADIYDKYRNDKASYDPNAKRGLKQAMFQTFASIMFPIAAVHAGQKIMSISARNFGKDGLSLQTQEEIIQHHVGYMSHRKLGDYNSDTYKAEYGKALDNYIDETMRTHKTKNPIKILMNLIFGGRHPEQLGKDRRGTIHHYIGQRIDTLFKDKKELLENKKPLNMSDKMFTKFQQLQEIYKKDPLHSKDYLDKATKDILKAVENNKVFKIKSMKTLGGFIALGLLIQPIDKFVEHIIIEKFIGPGLDKFDKAQINQFKEKVFKN